MTQHLYSEYAYCNEMFDNYCTAEPYAIVYFFKMFNYSYKFIQIQIFKILYY